jgi:PAS domain S-box-containing protein
LRGEAEAPPADFLTGGGAMGARIRAHGWAATPLGPLEAWPPSLRSAVGMVLGSKFPACLVWGPGLTTIHNDAFRPILGAKPEALGRPFSEVWSEAWHEVGPIAGRALAGEATFVEDFPLAVERGGGPERAFFTFCCSPVRDEAGRVAGFLDTVVETTGKVLAERDLRASEERLRAVFDQQFQFMAVLSPDGVTLEINGLPLRAAGLAREEVVGRLFWETPFWDGLPDMQRGWPGRLAEAAGREGPVLSRDCYRAAGGEVRTADAAVTAVKDRSGAVRFFVIQATDVTERARAEAALRGSEERFRLMADAVPQIVWITDAEGRAEFFNRQWSDYTGVPYEPTTAAEVAARFLHPDDAAPTTERFEAARRTGSTFLVEHRIRSKDGCYRWFLVRGEPHRDPRTGAVVRWFGASVDIHDRKSAEEANARLAAIVASTTDAIIAFAAEDARILSWNRGAQELFGYTEAEALGGPVGLLVPPDLPDGDPTGVFRRVMDGARVHEHETVRVAKSGERIPVSVTASRMLAPGGRVIGVAAIFRDLRQRKAVEERQALLAREVDHRAKNALAVVQTMLRLTRADDVPSFARAVEGRVAALARAQTLLAEGRWDGADLHSVLRGELAPFLAGQRVELDGPPVVLPPGAAQPLAMAAHELATNAAKHGALSVPGGRVSVSWRVGGGPGTGVLRLRWAEAGGPPLPGPPARRGFGSRVLDGTVRGQLGGAVSLTWARTGLVCEIEVPLRRDPSLARAMGADTAAAD